MIKAVQACCGKKQTVEKIIKNNYIMKNSFYQQEEN